MSFWTDYPIVELGDQPGFEAPVRKCEPIAYDGNKYCTVIVEDITTSFKSGYIYTKKGRCGDVPAITCDQLHKLPHKYPA